MRYQPNHGTLAALPLALLLCLGAGACNKDTKAELDSGSGNAMRDIDPTTRCGVLVTPDHLTTNWGPDLYFDVDYQCVGTWGKDELKDIKAATSLLELPAKTPVAVAWTHLYSSIDHTYRVKPVSPLAKDTDYLFQIKKQGYIIPYQEKNLYRVGSLPRVKEIGLNRDRKSYSSQGLLADIDIIFSEHTVPSSSAFKALSITEAATGKPLSLKLVNSNLTATIVHLTSPIPLTTEIQITLDADVGATTGVKLDGEYTGKQGSGALVVKIRPSDFVTQSSSKWWQPTLGL